MGFFPDAESTVEDVKTSKFNEGALKMIRIHEQQRMINLTRVNPFDMNETFGVFNYQARISACDSLLFECWSKLNEEKRQEGVNIKNVIERFLISHPINSTKKNQVYNKVQIRMDNSCWNILKKEIDKYEFKVREFLGDCGYDSPNKEEWDEDEL